MYEVSMYNWMCTKRTDGRSIPSTWYDLFLYLFCDSRIKLCKSSSTSRQFT